MSEFEKELGDIVKADVEAPRMDKLKEAMARADRRILEASKATQTTAGYKEDADKVRMELLAPEYLFATATVLTFGAVKYGDRNWESGIKYSRCFGALMRHMWAWWGGKQPTTENFLLGNLDDETAKSHLWHASCCLMFLIAYEERRLTAFDDRGQPNG